MFAALIIVLREVIEAGLIVGIAVTIGAAYVHHTSVAPTRAGTDGVPPLPVSGQETIVNWEVVQTLASRQIAFVRDLWKDVVGG